MDSSFYDLVIVGAGMIGSAAARYASQYRNLKVCVVGPLEPKDKEEKNCRDIFGAYYDQARITNSVQYDQTWAKLASRSIAEYRHIETLSGIHFYDEVGMMRIAIKDGKIIKNTRDAARAARQHTQILSQREYRDEYPYIYVGENESVLYQEKAGYVNPRLLIEAELKIAAANGCDIIRDIVSHIIYPESPQIPTVLRTDIGNVLHAKKVLLCPGAFIESRKLLPHGFAPEMQLITQSVIYAEVSQKDLQRMKNMPSIVKSIESDKNAENNCYILPPVKYPDGKHYIKLGHGDQFDLPLSKEKIQEWYCQDIPAHIKERLVKTLNTVFPDFKPLSITGDNCLTTRTKNRRLFVDLLSPNLAIAIAGNGYAAKSCDHIGKLSAELILSGTWTSDLPRDWFRFQTLQASL